MSISGTDRHRQHWFTKCGCGRAISTCGCNGALRGEGPVRTIKDGCDRCKGLQARFYEMRKPR